MADEQAAPVEGGEEELVLEEGDKLENQEEQQPPSVEDLARDMGWKPEDEFKGEGWKPADQFIRDGHDIQRNLGRELKSLKSTVDNMQRTSTTLLEQRLEEERTKIAAQYEAAVEDGDAKAAAESLRKLDRLEIPATPTLSAEAQAFQDRHSAWLGKDVLATERAVEICNTLAKHGKSQAEQLAEAETVIRRERPDLFPAPAKRQAAVNESRRDASSPKGKNGFAQLPPEAQKVALDMEDRLNIPRETYAANFFSQQPAQRRA